MHTISVQLHICHTHNSVKNTLSYWMMTGLYTTPSHFSLQFAFKKKNIFVAYHPLELFNHSENFQLHLLPLSIYIYIFSDQILPYPQPGILECLINLMNSISQGSCAFFGVNFPPLKIEFWF